MNSNKENLSQISENNAIKTLLEISQEKTIKFFYNDNDIQGWKPEQSIKTLEQKAKKNSEKFQRPLTSMGKPPLFKKITLANRKKIRNRKSEILINPLKKKIPRLPQKPLRSVSNVQIITPQSLPGLSSISKSHKESKSLVSPIDAHSNRDINISFRKKMMKYKILKDFSVKESYTGLSLVNMFRPIKRILK